MSSRKYLYVPANNLTGIYKINLNNSADVTFIEFGFTSAGTSMSGASTSVITLVLVNDLLIGYDYMIKPDDTVVQIIGSKRLPYMGTPLFQYKEVVGGGGGSSGSNWRTTFFLTQYLATINNLSSAVVKNTDKSMKITYELTEITE